MSIDSQPFVCICFFTFFKDFLFSFSSFPYLTLFFPFTNSYLGASKLVFSKAWQELPMSYSIFCAWMVLSYIRVFLLLLLLNLNFRGLFLFSFSLFLLYYYSITSFTIFGIFFFYVGLKHKQSILYSESC